MRIATFFFLSGLMVAASLGCSATHAYMAPSDAMAASRPVSARAAAAPVGEASAPGASGPAGNDALPKAHSRDIVYTGSMTLAATDAEDTMTRIQGVAEALGGFLGKWEAQVITIRVPVAQFNTALDHIAALGTVRDKQIGAVDVTDQLRDLDARIANAETMRKRLADLVERSGKMEELLKVEQELARVTEQLERLQALRVSLSESAAFSTLAVRVIEAQPTPKPTFAQGMPFAWINTVGSEIRSGRSFNRADRKFGKGVDVELPERFVRFWQEDYVTVAMSSQRVVVKVQRHRNFDEAGPAFWADLIAGHLDGSRLVAVSDRADMQVRHDDPAVLLQGKRSFGRGDYGYLIAVATSDDYVYTYEAWGPIAAFTAATPQLQASIETLKASSGW